MATTKKAPAAKKAAPAPDQAEGNDGTGAGNDSDDGTSLDQREGSTSEATDSDAAPVDAPASRHGDPATSSDHVQAASGGHSSAGEHHDSIVDSDGNPLGADDLFDESDQRKTFVIAKTRVYELFNYPNAKGTSKRLLFAQGRQVPRDKAERLKAAIRDHS